MNVKELTYLGYATLTSKKTNKPFNLAYFYQKAEASGTAKVAGYQSLSFFVDDDQLKDLKNLQPLTSVKADVRFIGGQNVFIGLV